MGFSALHRSAAGGAGGVRGRAARSVERPDERSNPKLPRHGRTAPARRRPDVVAEAADLETALACLSAGADRVCVPTHALDAGRRAERRRSAHAARAPRPRDSGGVALRDGGPTVTVGNLGLIGPGFERRGRGRGSLVTQRAQRVTRSSSSRELGAAARVALARALRDARSPRSARRRVPVWGCRCGVVRRSW